MSEFGKTWWGAQWLNSLNNIDYNNRLPRGASYARKGAVEKLKIDGNQIHAKVSGSRSTPYKVTIILPPFFDPELSQFITRIANRPVIMSKMLNKELHPSVLEIAEELGLKVFPSQWTDFKMQCSCPDWAVPCKHLASVVYKVSSSIDNNPFLVFDLHNVDLIEEMKKLGVVVDKEQAEVPSLNDLYFQPKSKSLNSYIPESEYDKLNFSSLKPIEEPLVALLTDNPVFYQKKNQLQRAICRHHQTDSQELQVFVVQKNEYRQAARRKQ